MPPSSINISTNWQKNRVKKILWPQENIIFNCLLRYDFDDGIFVASSLKFGFKLKMGKKPTKNDLWPNFLIILFR